MIRGNQEVEDRQVVHEEEEEMKMENKEGTENMEGNESNENMSSGAISGEISGNGAPQKRTRPNNAQAVSTGVANDRKQALPLQIAVRGLIETFGMRAATIYNSMNNINKATPIPNRLNINSTDNNSNINGTDNVIQNEENSISVNSIDNKINIYDANNISGVNNFIQNGENNNLVNNRTGNININDDNNNSISG
jgi:hypothetical protein